MDLGFNLAQSNRDLKDPTSRQNFGDTSGLLCKNDLIPCHNDDQIKMTLTAALPYHLDLHLHLFEEHHRLPKIFVRKCL